MDKSETLIIGEDESTEPFKLIVKENPDKPLIDEASEEHTGSIKFGGTGE